MKIPAHTVCAGFVEYKRYKKMMTEFWQQVYELVKILSLLLFNPLILILVCVFVIKRIIKNFKSKEYEKSEYYKSTHIKYNYIKLDNGRFGEYLTYRNLKQFEKQGARFLFNAYIPKSKTETTEIDIIMLYSKGVFVFESKNISGWIFGDSTQQKWYQTLNTNEKHSFYNPVMQNRAHIRHLRVIIGERVPIHSVIVFSDRCVFKSLNVRTDDVDVIHRRDVESTVVKRITNINSEISEDEISDMYNKLYPFTQSDIDIIDNHTNNVVNNYSDNGPNTYEKSVSDVRICPYCGSKLILRTATRGVNIGKAFYGCSNYPQCKYVQNINTDFCDKKL